MSKTMFKTQPEDITRKTIKHCRKKRGEASKTMFKTQPEDITRKTIRHWRKKRGYSQRYLASRCYTTHATINHLESGHQHITIHWLYLIALALNVNPITLLPSAGEVYKTENLP